MLGLNVSLLCFAVVAICIVSAEGFSIGDFNDPRCDQMKICTLIYQPVCGSDGKTYGNECVLSRCPGVNVVHEGECKAKSQQVDDDGCDQTKICHLLDEPVCGSDGKTYGNDCELSRCPGVKMVHEGECKAEREEDSDDGCDQTKICYLLDAPVCGSDGKTYGNDCELSRCPGVTLVHEGECKRR